MFRMHHVLFLLEIAAEKPMDCIYNECKKQIPQPRTASKKLI